MGRATSTTHVVNTSGSVLQDGPIWLRRLKAGSTSVPVVDEAELPQEEVEESPKQRKLRERKERMEAFMAGPPPAAEALRKAMAWQAEIEAGDMTRARIARRERVTRARVTQVMSLLDLPEDVKVKLLEDDDAMKGMSIREALRTAAG